MPGFVKANVTTTPVLDKSDDDSVLHRKNSCVLGEKPFSLKFPQVFYLLDRNGVHDAEANFRGYAGYLGPVSAAALQGLFWERDRFRT